MEWADRDIEVATLCAMMQASIEMGYSGSNLKKLLDMSMFHSRVMIILDRWRVPLPSCMVAQGRVESNSIQ